MRSRYLTRHGDSWVFQIRVPRRLDPSSSFSSLRVSIGVMPARQARILSTVLAGAAQTLFARTTMNDISHLDHEERRDLFTSRIEALIPMFRGLHTLDQSVLPNDLKTPAADHAFDVLAAIGFDQARGHGLYASTAIDHAAPMLAMLRDEDLARAYVDPQPDTGEPKTQSAKVAEQLASQTELLADLLRKQAEPSFKGPLFSAAADKYIKKLEDAHGEDYDELKYLKHRKVVFIQICGDKPVDAYTLDDLQHFMNEVSWLPANISKQPDYDVNRVCDYIDENRNAPKGARKKTLGKSTLENNYVGKVKTIIRAGCHSAHVPYLLSGARIITPKRARPAKPRHAPAREVFTDTCPSSPMPHTCSSRWSAGVTSADRSC
ncbi:hypothetical protein N177_0849 [Lutibaculum baratangense AMV1]|uniref:Uncharacterized protein n=2 Tax=Lutibaculum TaxID=1358438 RepID=V4RM18_9HYPH|nr:hypothetical protein N177_0849 [Lutibaculum baratangense AMV1]